MSRAPKSVCRNVDEHNNENEQTNKQRNENEMPSRKSDLKNCVTYVENQCGKHTLDEMAGLLKIARATFYGEIKGLAIDKANQGNQECEFWLRKDPNDDILHSTVVITEEMQEYLRNACNLHEKAEMARLLGVTSY